jgi:hypothetical protein
MWLTIWFMVILKIPIAYLAYVIWWAVKDPPEPRPEIAVAARPMPDDNLPWRPRPRGGRRRPDPALGPHGRATRRAQPARLQRTGARSL